MPRAAILLALLLIIHGPARPQGPGARGAVQHAIPGANAAAAPAVRSRTPAAPFLSISVISFDPPAAGSNPSIPGAGSRSGHLPDLSELRGMSYQDSGPDTSDRARGKKSSWTAVGFSAILPGAGQVYTENYWKVPIIWGLGGYWVYEWTRNNDRYREFRDLFSQSVAAYPPYGDERYLRLREYYKDQRDSFTWYLGILYLLNVVDAYVGAELYDFDVGPDLGAAPGGGMHASLTVRLPVGR